LSTKDWQLSKYYAKMIVIHNHCCKPIASRATLSRSCDLGQQLPAGPWVDLPSAPSSQKPLRLSLELMLAANSELGSLGAVAEGQKPMTVHTI
jgi:hypothetical protein